MIICVFLCYTTLYILGITTIHELGNHIIQHQGTTQAFEHYSDVTLW